MQYLTRRRIALRGRFYRSLILIAKGLASFEGLRMLRNPEKANEERMVIIERRCFVRSQAVVSRVVAGETLIVPVRGKVGDLASIYSFNETGSLIWKLLETPRTVGEVVSAMAEEYEVEIAQARAGCDRICQRDESSILVVGRSCLPRLWQSAGTERASGAGRSGGGRGKGRPLLRLSCFNHDVFNRRMTEEENGSVKLRRVQRGYASAASRRARRRCRFRLK